MDEILAQGMAFFVGGYETTATSIAFLLYNLALNQEIQEKVHEEILDIAGNQAKTRSHLYICTFKLNNFPRQMSASKSLRNPLGGGG